ncbi:MAG: hypothetical protein H6858_02915 [Rhodospirillales bacterium]|nr:hypothetical protein [Alphaproteobacteria bacterium]MCB9976534.1 hypothetical protein [Rhodospirillales bacterium]
MLLRLFVLVFLATVLLTSIAAPASYAQNEEVEPQNEDEDEFMSVDSLLPPVSAEGYHESIKCIDVNFLGESFADKRQDAQSKHYFQLGSKKAWIFARALGRNLGFSDEDFQKEEKLTGNAEAQKMIKDPAYYRSNIGRCQRLGLIYGDPLASLNEDPPPQAGKGNSNSNQKQIQAAINDKFMQWALSWMIDRYVPGSAKIERLDCGAGGCEAYGSFTFTRGNASASIPFEAEAPETAPNTFIIGRLCYSDTTTGTADCVN